MNSQGINNSLGYNRSVIIGTIKRIEKLINNKYYYFWYIDNELIMINRRFYESFKDFYFMENSNIFKHYCMVLRNNFNIDLATKDYYLINYGGELLKRNKKRFIEDIIKKN